MERGSSPPTERSPISCATLISGSSGQVKADLETICAADTYDPGCACPGQSHSREAFERLLQAGEGNRLIGLASSASPGARAFARDAMERTSGWTVERIEAALADEAVVESAHTPSRCDVHVEHLSTAGLEAALVHQDRAAMDPLLRAWAARGTPVGLAKALYLRGDEPWISTRRLHRIVSDPEVTEEIRAAAASALAKRGERTPAEPLYRLARSASPWVARVGVETLDALGDARAWAELAPSEPHHGYRGCVEPWTCPDQLRASLCV